MGPDGTHPQVLKDLTNVIARSLSIIFERSLCVPEDLKKASVIPIFNTEEGESKEQQGCQPHLNASKGEGTNNPRNLVVNQLNISQKSSLQQRPPTPWAALGTLPAG